jgi:hypothetical protein
MDITKAAIAAAENIDSKRDKYSCGSLFYEFEKQSNINDAFVVAKHYSELFCPHEGNDHGPWGDEWGIDDNECRQCRVLALLFFSAMNDS